MQIDITQPSEEVAGDLVFWEPKFHFGQVLEDKRGRQGFVFGMYMSDNWHYEICYENGAISEKIVETDLALSTETVQVIPETFITAS